MAPGFATMIGGRSQPGTMVKLFSFLIDKARVPITLELEGETRPVALPEVEPLALEATREVEPLAEPTQSEHRVPLLALAYGRSGDKGDHSNIGVVAREPRFFPLIDAALTREAVATHLAHLLDPTRGRVRRYVLPGTHALNFVLEHALGGGGIASLRPDPQGKAHAQQLLAFEVPVPRAIYDELRQDHAGGAQ
jgi:hypothetical protein